MYKIVGADNKEYGPVSREEILQWIAQGRANAKTIARFEEGAWKPLATFDEFKTALDVPGTPPPVTGIFASTPPMPTMVVRKANTSAISGLVCGILGILCCPCLGPILAIVFGVSGLNQIKASPNTYTTDTSVPKIAIGLGIAGLVLTVGQILYVMFGGGLSLLEQMTK